MTLASDPNPGPKSLSATSRRMLELRDAVFFEWEKRVRASVKNASTLRHPILIDTLPAFYDNMAEAVTPEYPRTNAIDATTIATEHGGERARMTNYDPQSLIREYQLFRWTVFDVLKQNGVQLGDDELLVINTSVDDAIREAVTAFAVIQSTLREQFVAALSHDLRNPLASANLAAQLIARTGDTPHIRGLANKVTENLFRMDRMIQDLLNTVSFERGAQPRLDLSRFDILEVAKEVCEQSIADHGPRFQVAGRSVNGYWSREALKRALENLVGNAVKYGTPDTPIRIKVDEAYGRLTLSVHNEGNPIPPEELECIFQVYRRAQAAKQGEKQGWGIGLPYVRGTAESHGGSVSVDSTVERGTSFLIDIPVDARPYQNAPTVGDPN
jgi:signal transduction histidine kinase